MHMIKVQCCELVNSHDKIEKAFFIANSGGWTIMDQKLTKKIFNPLWTKFFFSGHNL